MTYNNQKAWKEIEKFLPPEYHFRGEYQPAEELWNWKGNKVHLDTFRNPDAEAKMICFHGVGTNGRQISLIIGGPLAKEGFETISVDMPTYGVTEVNPKMRITYADWVQCGSDLVEEELKKDDRPVFLYGLSAGGMETYHIAAKNGRVRGIIGMTFLDQRQKPVQITTASTPFWGHAGAMLAKLACAAGYITYKPEVEPKEFSVCPILLTQPEKDGWTPQFLSDDFLNQIEKVPVTKTVLQNGSHYPIEKEALSDLQTSVLSFLRNQLAMV